MSTCYCYSTVASFLSGTILRDFTVLTFWCKKINGVDAKKNIRNF